MSPPEHGSDRPGGDLRSFPASGWQECSNSCASLKECWAYTFVAEREGGTCWLKDDVPVAVSYQRAVSGVKIMGPYERGLDRPGEDLKPGFASDDPPACLRACQGEPLCWAWTWVKPEGKGPGKCWLKSGSPAAVRNDCCFSGIRIVATTASWSQPEPPEAKSAQILKPGVAEGFNPQPEPPKLKSAGVTTDLEIKGFNPQPEPPDPSTVGLGGNADKDATPKLRGPQHVSRTGLDGDLEGGKRTESGQVLPGVAESSSLDDVDQEEDLQLRPSDVDIVFKSLPLVARVDAEPEQEESASPERGTAELRRPAIQTNLTPTPRNDLIASIVSLPGGPGLLAEIGVSVPVAKTGGPGLQAGLHAPALKPDASLEEIFRQGITLYASGKITPGGYDPKEAPLAYETMHGWGHSQDAPPSDERLPIRSLEKSDVLSDVEGKYIEKTAFNAQVLRLEIRAPGDGWYTYSVEIDFRGLGGFASYNYPRTFTYNEPPTDWHLTDKGTLIALVRLRGGATTRFYFYRTQVEGFDREFRWLHVTKL